MKLIGDINIMFGFYQDSLHCYNSALKYFKNENDNIASGTIYEGIYMSLYYYSLNLNNSNLELNRNYIEEYSKIKVKI